jgi:hypothetical protein
MATNTQIPVADRRVPVIAPGYTFHTITEKISNIVLKRPVSLGWILGFLIVFGMLNLLAGVLAYLFLKGVGIWGINIPVGWGFAIINFVWWIGIGHAGTLISAILALLRQTWRNSINRFTGCFRIRTPCAIGRTSAVRWCGTYLQFRLTSLFRWCSGLSD